MGSTTKVDQDRIDYRFQTGDHDLDRLILQARQARRFASVADQQARRLTIDTLAALTELHLPTRDLAVLLAISHQRVQQLRHGR